MKQLVFYPSKRHGIDKSGEKLPALINASLTLVPGDGIYCFGYPPISADRIKI